MEGGNFAKLPRRQKPVQSQKNNVKRYFADFEQVLACWVQMNKNLFKTCFIVKITGSCPAQSQKNSVRASSMNVVLTLFC